MMFISETLEKSSHSKLGNSNPAELKSSNDYFPHEL